MAAHLSAANVRTLLRKKGFENLTDEYSNDEIVGWMIEIREEEYPEICKMQERLELVTARERAEHHGLDWPEDKAT